MNQILSRKLIIVLAVLAFGFSLCYYVRIGPQLTIAAIQTALEGEEEASLDGYIDRDRFRESVHVLFASSIPDSTEKSGELTDTATMLADGMWMGMFLSHFISEIENESTSQHFNSWSSYSVVQPLDNEHGYEFVLERYGVSWKLCEVKSY